METHLEVERKYDVGVGTEVPALDGVADGVRPGEVREHRLEAVYLDTDDLRLRAARITLRHRTGDDEAGWHLKLPAGRDRLELRVPGEPPPAEVPPELAALVRARTRRAPVVPVARLVTARTVHPLVDHAGRLLAEVVDDVVEGSPLGGPAVRWREWEVELAAGEPDLLDALGARLRRAGAVPSSSSSKVARVLDARSPEQAWWTATSVPAVDRDATAGELLHAHLAQQVEELLARDPQVRRDGPEAVHKMRVAARRLRSALRTFRPLLDREVTDPVRDELRWLGASLGRPRDAEVMHERLTRLLAEQPADLVLGPVASRVDDVLRRDYREGHSAVVADLDSDRCLALYDRLDALVDAPPLRPRASEPARKALPPLVRRVDRSLAAGLAQAKALPPGAAHDSALHEARKTAKQLRYACEAVEPVFGRPAGRLASAATELQELLGEHQDSVTTRDALRRLGAGSSRSGQNGFTFGRLHALEEAWAHERADLWLDAWRRASKGKLHRWLER